MIRAISPFKHIAAAFILLALAVRIVVPSGFMPSGERGFAITICTGGDTQTVWMDKTGKLHKEDPSKGKTVDHQPCAFAGAIAANDFVANDFHIDLPPVATVAPAFAIAEASIGTGLAAPPPPAIGPPSYV